MKTKEVVDELTVKRAITRITYEIIERNKDLNKIVLAGIKTRGVFIAHRIQERLEQLENLSVPVVELDTKPSPPLMMEVVIVGLAINSL